MTARDDLLRAAVGQAYAERGSAGFTAACKRVLDIWTCWPLIEYHYAIETAQGDLLRERARGAAAVALGLQTLREVNEIVGRRRAA